jgi:hypothetical protein
MAMETMNILTLGWEQSLRIMVTVTGNNKNKVCCLVEFNSVEIIHEFISMPDI